MCKMDFQSAINHFSSTYLKLILEPNRPLAHQFVQESIKNNHHTIEEIYIGFEIAMYQVGQLWQNNEISIADEHLATAITQECIMYCYPTIINKNRIRGNVISFTIEDELHDLGIKFINHMLEYHGYNVTYLGSDIPITNVLSYLRINKPDYIAISVTIYSHVNNAITLTKMIKEDPLLRDCKIIIGGYCFKSNNSLLELVMHDLYVDSLSDLLIKINTL